MHRVVTHEHVCSSELHTAPPPRASAPYLRPRLGALQASPGTSPSACVRPEAALARALNGASHCHAPPIDDVLSFASITSRILLIASEMCARHAGGPGAVATRPRYPRRGYGCIPLLS